LFGVGALYLCILNVFNTGGGVGRFWGGPRACGGGGG